MQKPQETVESFSLTIFFQPVPSGRKFMKVLPQVEKDGNMMNLCSGFGAGFITGAPFSKEKKAVATLQETSLYTCMEAPADVNDYSCPYPDSKPGVIYPNFIGTFCHKSYLQRWTPCNIKSTDDRCCGLFNGGANSGELEQPPFPEYYFKKGDQHLKKMPKHRPSNIQFPKKKTCA